MVNLHMVLTHLFDSLFISNDKSLYVGYMQTLQTVHISPKHILIPLHLYCGFIRPNFLTNYVYYTSPFVSWIHKCTHFPQKHILTPLLVQVEFY